MSDLFLLFEAQMRRIVRYIFSRSHRIAWVADRRIVTCL